jgi:hypothetical protein
MDNNFTQNFHKKPDKLAMQQQRKIILLQELQQLQQLQHQHHNSVKINRPNQPK